MTVVSVFVCSSVPIKKAAATVAAAMVAKVARVMMAGARVVSHATPDQSRNTRSVTQHPISHATPDQSCNTIV